MIKTEKEYELTKAQVAKFEEGLANFSTSMSHSSLHPLLLKAQEESLKSQLNDLKEQICQYELTKECRTNFCVNDLQDLPTTLIKARIASGLSQRGFADFIGIDENELIEFENSHYKDASSEILTKAAEALDVELPENTLQFVSSTTPRELFRQLKEIGLDRNFILQRIAPRDLVKDIRSLSTTDLLETVAVVKRVFGLDIEDKHDISFIPTTGLRFKMPSGVNEQRANIYTSYAFYVGQLVLKATAHIEQKKVPSSAESMRSSILHKYGSMTFENVLRYVWEDLGIPVLPLNDPGSFHGVFWRMGGRNIIILKQRNFAVARWLFDLLHEVYHASQEPELSERTIIEFDDVKEMKNSDEELRANSFAWDSILEGRAEELMEECITLSGYRLNRLKTAVQRVATKEDVPVDSLANYIAFRLWENGKNWWPAAATLQTNSIDPWAVTRDMLLQKADFGKLEDTDKRFLFQSLEELEV